MNIRGVWAIYKFEMNRAIRTIGQTLMGPVISTALYFIVFGSALGDRIENVQGIPYSSFIVPGLVLLTVLSQSLTNAGFSIFAPRIFGTIYEILSAPLSLFEMTLGYCGAAITKSIILSFVVMISAIFFVDYHILHPLWMLFFLVMTSVIFCLLGYIVGFIAEGFEQLNILPLLVITPLTFLGGSFYSIDMLPPFWRSVSLLNPVVYLISGFKWSFYEVSDVNLEHSVIMVVVFFIIMVATIIIMYRSGRFLRT